MWLVAIVLDSAALGQFFLSSVTSSFLPSLHEVLLQYVTQILERNCCLCELCMCLLNFAIT